MNRSDLKRITKTLFSDKLWTLEIENFSKAKKNTIRFIKLVRITLEEFAESRMGFQCAALSFFVALSAVPLAVFVFAVTSNLGYSEWITQTLYDLIPAYPAIINMIVEKADSFIEISQSNIVGFVSAFTLLWSSIWLMFQVERVFNNVWKINHIRTTGRKIYKRFSFYIILLILIPFLVVLFCSGIIMYSSLPSMLGINLDIKEVSTMVTILGWIVFYLIASLIISAMYKWIPATKVKYKYAYISALVSGFAFTVFQYIYLGTQVLVSRWNLVYGVLAAIPLFLIWLNTSWFILIYGEQLCYSLHHIDTYHIPEGGLLEFNLQRNRNKEVVE